MGSLRGRMRHWGRLAIANPVAFVATFTLGAVLAFAYSYVPLHTVKHRKLERLERTLLQQEEAIAALEGELEGAQLAASKSSQDEALASLESARDEARRAAEAARQALKAADKRAGKLERERDDWKRKLAALEKRSAEAARQRLAEAPAPAALGTQDASAGAAVAGARPPAGHDARPAAPQPDAGTRPGSGAQPAAPAP